MPVSRSALDMHRTGRPRMSAGLWRRLGLLTVFGGAVALVPMAAPALFSERPSEALLPEAGRFARAAAAAVPAVPTHVGQTAAGEILAAVAPPRRLPPEDVDADAVPAPAAPEPALRVAAGPGAADTSKLASVSPAATVSIEDMARRFAALAATGPVPEPRNAPEWYHNARTAEMRGDAVEARRAYLKVAGLDLDAVDPWSRLAALVLVQDGRSGARQVFATLADRNRAPAFELVAATLAEDADRRRRIEAFMAMNPDYGPGWYLYADEFSESRLGSQTIGEKRRERDALNRFLQAEEAGLLKNRFLDLSMLADWLDKARRRRGVLETALINMPSEPRAIFTRSNADWSVYVQLPEPATGFSYRLGEAGPMVQAGPAVGIDQRTGRPSPNTTISVVPGAEPQVIEVAYQDLRGSPVGPFRIPFDPMSALVGQQRQALEMTKGSWVAYREGSGLTLYTTHLMTYRCTIAKATYGLDSEPVDKAIPLPPCDPKDPFSVPSGATPYFKIPATTRSVTVRLEFRDGSRSETTLPRR